MNDQAYPSSHGKVLEKIASEFRRFREEVGGHHSVQLKSMAISAVGAGFSRSQVAEAAGVSVTTISNWALRAPKAKRLRLVAGPESQGVCEARLAADLICIRLASGVEIDFPRSELSSEFLVILSGIGGNR